MNEHDVVEANAVRRKAQANFNAINPTNSHQREERKLVVLESIALELNLLRQGLGELILTIRHK